MKLVAHAQGVAVPAYVVAEAAEAVAEAGQQLPFPYS